MFHKQVKVYFVYNTKMVFYVVHLHTQFFFYEKAAVFKTLLILTLRKLKYPP